MFHLKESNSRGDVFDEVIEVEFYYLLDNYHNNIPSITTKYIQNEHTSKNTRLRSTDNSF